MTLVSLDFVRPYREEKTELLALWNNWDEYRSPSGMRYMEPARCVGLKPKSEDFNYGGKGRVSV